MNYRLLGKTGLKVPEISFGPGNNNVTDDREGMAQIEEAFDLGITLFDTANFEKKGKVEEWLGRVFEGKRDEVVIATKFSGDATRKYIVTECEKSLKRLKTDYILIGANNVAQLRQCASASGHALSAEECREVDEIRGVLPGCVTASGARK